MESKLNCILLVDDDEPTNFLNMEVIREIDCANHIQIAETGDEALDYLTSAGKFTINVGVHPQPNLIFLDINMPGMDGWEFLERFRVLHVEKQDDIKIVMLTTSLNPDDEHKARATDEITDFITKPLTKEVLLAILRL